jgi:hypothetical protein
MKTLSPFSWFGEKVKQATSKESTKHMKAMRFSARLYGVTSQGIGLFEAAVLAALR